MSDKEKLEEMKNKVTGLTDSEGYFADAVSMDVGVYVWFYKQAERVHELEEERKRYQSGRNVAVATKMKMDDLEKQNKRYREALESIQDIQDWQRKEAYFEVLEIVKRALKELE